MNSRLNHRFWEIDFLRGVAIVMMVTYHLVWDLSYFGIADVDVVGGFWFAFARTTATLFLLLVGVALQLSAARARLAQESEAAVWRRQLRRGLTVLAWGLVVTLVTRLVLPEAFVRFGILHLIGLSMVLAYPFLRLGAWNLGLGLAVIVLGWLLQQVAIDGPWLLWLGLKPGNLSTVDYFPLLPWFGVVLIGLFLGDLIYGGYVRRRPLPDRASLPPVRAVCWLGRHALAIYLLHQPVLIATLVVLGLISVDALVAS